MQREQNDDWGIFLQRGVTMSMCVHKNQLQKYGLASLGERMQPRFIMFVLALACVRAMQYNASYARFTFAGLALFLCRLHHKALTSRNIGIRTLFKPFYFN